jgi:hypothetical protein
MPHLLLLLPYPDVQALLGQAGQQQQQQTASTASLTCQLLQSRGSDTGLTHVLLRVVPAAV